MKWLALFLSFFFLVTHELIPHHHHEELSANEHEKEHQKAQDVIDFFSLVFHQNLGNHHLQEIVFSSSENSVQSRNCSEVAQKAICQFSNLPSYSVFFHSQKTATSQGNFKKSTTQFFKDQQRRGPPVG